MRVYVIITEQMTSSGEWDVSTFHTARNTFRQAVKSARRSMKEHSCSEIKESKYNPDPNLTHSWLDWITYSDDLVTTVKPLMVRNRKDWKG